MAVTIKGAGQIEGLQASGISSSESVGFLQAGTNAVPRTVQSKLRDVVSVKDFGAVGDGVADDTAAIQAAVSASISLGVGLCGVSGDTYLVNSTIDLSGLQYFDFSESLIKQANGAELTNLVVYSTAGSSGVFYFALNVDGNSANNTAAVTGAKFANNQSPSFVARVNAVNCATGVEITGNQETSTFYCGVRSCDVGVLIQTDGVSTPDENKIYVSGRGCKKFAQIDNSTCVVEFNCETTTDATEYAVTCTPPRSTVLSGLIRGAIGGGVKLVGGSVFFDDLHFATTGTASGGLYILHLDDVGSAFGSLSAITCNDNFAFIEGGATGGTNLELFATSITGDCLVLGSSGKTVNQATIKLNARTVSGDALRIESATQCDITYERLIAPGNGLNFNAGNTQNTITLPARAYLTPMTWTSNSNTQVIFDGILSIAERDAIPNPVAGMILRANRQQGFVQNIYNGSAWINYTPEFGQLSGSGSPVGSVTPQYILQMYRDTAANDVYIATTTTSSGWKKITP